MIEMDLDHCGIVKASLDRDGSLDREARASLEVLSRRLESLKQHYPQLGQISFSPQIVRQALPTATLTGG